MFHVKHSVRGLPGGLPPSRLFSLLPCDPRRPHPGLRGYDNTRALRDGASGGGTMPPSIPAVFGDAVDIRCAAATVTIDPRTGRPGAVNEPR